MRIEEIVAATRIWKTVDQTVVWWRLCRKKQGNMDSKVNNKRRLSDSELKRCIVNWVAEI